MKWYTFLDEEGSTTVNMILDHNTTTYVEAGENMKTAIAKLNTDTQGWKVAPGTSPRLISADEVAKIVGADREDTLKWASTKAYKEAPNFLLEGNGNTIEEWNKNLNTEKKYTWLYENMKGTGSYFEYWTSTLEFNSPDYGWMVSYNTDNCALASMDIYVQAAIRPVITISKSDIR